MKTIEYLRTELKLNFGRKRLFLKDVLMYLETNPRIEFLQSEKERLENIIFNKNEKYNYWIENVVSLEVPKKSRRTLFNKETGIVDCRRFLKTINYILSPPPAIKTEAEQQPTKTIKNVNRRKNSKQNKGVRKQI